MLLSEFIAVGFLRNDEVVLVIITVPFSFFNIKFDYYSA